MSGKLMAIIGADATITDVRDAAIMLSIANRAGDDGQGARPDLAELARWGRCRGMRRSGCAGRSWPCRSTSS